MKQVPRSIDKSGSVALLPSQPDVIESAVVSVRVPDAVIYTALGAIASVLEETHCVVGRDELEQLVKAHRGLTRCLGEFGQDYAWKDGKAILARSPDTQVKVPLSSAEQWQLRRARWRRGGRS